MRHPGRQHDGDDHPVPGDRNRVTLGELMGRHRPGEPPGADRHGRFRPDWRLVLGGACLTLGTLGFLIAGLLVVVPPESESTPPQSSASAGESGVEPVRPMSPEPAALPDPLALPAPAALPDPAAPPGTVPPVRSAGPGYAGGKVTGPVAGRGASSGDPTPVTRTAQAAATKPASTSRSETRRPPADRDTDRDDLDLGDTDDTDDADRDDGSVDGRRDTSSDDRSGRDDGGLLAAVGELAADLTGTLG